MREIAEADWKVLRQLHTLALDRYCQGVLSEVGRLAAVADQSAHQRYLAVFAAIRERNCEIAETFDDLRRSTALLRLVSMRAKQLISDDEFSQFTAPTREAVDAILAVRSV